MSFDNLLKSISENTSLLQREVMLLVKTPKDYLYSFTYSTKEKIKIEEYDRKVTDLGNSLVKQVHDIYPDLVLHFIGSAALEIPGQRDIDLLIESVPDQFNTYLPGLISVFGKPKKQRKSFIEWETRLEGCSIDLIMCESSNEILRGPLAVFNILKENKKYLEEYQNIKLASNHVSVREYKKRRLAFFNKLRNL